MDVPEIDGIGYLENEDDSLKIGEFVEATVIDVMDYDLVCKYKNIEKDRKWIN